MNTIRRKIALTLVLAALQTALISQSPAQSRPRFIKAGRLFTGTDDHYLEKVYLEIKDGKIVAEQRSSRSRRVTREHPSLIFHPWRSSHCACYRFVSNVVSERNGDFRQLSNAKDFQYETCISTWAVRCQSQLGSYRAISWLREENRE
jgi:hypothetical protein